MLFFPNVPFALLGCNCNFLIVFFCVNTPQLLLSIFLPILWRIHCCPILLCILSVFMQHLHCITFLLPYPMANCRFTITFRYTFTKLRVFILLAYTLS